ncbi:MAG: DNA-binding response regulator, partial [bacterium]|nr:DNA-binding response regulator [bacterium]
IRRKLEKNPAEPKYIFTEVGVGYRMTDNEV